MAVGVYLRFRGNCREAVQFYAQAFGVDDVTMSAYGDMPDAKADEATRDLIMHAEIKAMGSALMCADVPPGMDVSIGTNAGVIVTSGDERALRRLFSQLSVGGEVLMPIQETFWSACYGWVTDKYGVQWQVSLTDK